MTTMRTLAVIGDVHGNRRALEAVLEDVERAGESGPDSRRSPRRDSGFAHPPIRPELRALLGAVDHEVVLCGHSHVPRLVQAGSEQRVVNPGSVGLPAYTDDAPHPHAMEAGSPHARYALLTEGPEGWDVTHVALTYDWAGAAVEAEDNGRPDWGDWIRTGRAAAGR